MTDHLESVIEAAWEDRANVSAVTHGEVRDAVEQALEMLDSGRARVASRGADGTWTAMSLATVTLMPLLIRPAAFMDMDVYRIAEDNQVHAGSKLEP